MSNSTSAQSPPPPSTQSPPPPSSPSPPPPSDSSSPPPPPSDSSSPPPPPSGNGSPPPPSNNNGNSTPPPPSSYNKKSSPPPPKSNYWSSPPPPPSSGSSSSFKSHSPPTPSSNDDSLSANSSLNERVVLIGLAAGAGLLVLIMAIFLISASRRRKRRPRDNMQYYRDNSHGHNSGYYHNSSGWPSNAPGNSHELRMHPMPPSAQVSSEYDWSVKPPPPPPQMLSSVELASRTSSGSQRQGRTPPPPLHPQLSVGYNQSSFTYDDLASATGGFASTNLLGQGGFGYVYKGVLPNGKEVAIKSLKANSGQGEREFQAEVDIISRVHHRHLVSLVGYCIAGSQRMLVYEFVAKDTLERHLHGEDKTPMDWATRLNIAIGSAKGFAYLHEDCHPRIIHRDIKASNILLDENFDAKVADFGLAKLSSDTMTHVSTRIMGTFGYLAPEYAASGKLSEKSDVYSFGVVLLELITGKRPIDLTSDDEDSLVEWARPILISATEGECGYEELADPLLEGEYDPQEMHRMIACASACTRHSARTRPRMSQIVRTLEGDGSLADLDESVKTSRQMSTSSSEYDLRKMKKTAMSSQEFSSNEYGRSAEFTHSSGGESREMNPTRRENVERLA